MSCSRGFIAAVLLAVCFRAIVGDGTAPAQQDGPDPKAKKGAFEQVAEALTPQQEKELKQEAQALHDRGLKLRAEGRYEEALRCWEQTLAKAEQLYSKDRYPQGHLELAASVNNLGHILLDRGELVKAEAYYRQAHEMRQKLFPADKYPQGHFSMHASLASLGNLHRARGELAKAEPYYRQALAMGQKLFPQAHTRVVMSLTDLARLLQDRGELAKAEPYYRQALEMAQRLYPAHRHPQGHPQLAMSLNNLGMVLQARGDPAKAEPYYRQALEMRQKLHSSPQGHPGVADSLNNMGFVLQARGELAKAERYYRQALEMYQKLYPADKYPQGHPQRAISLNNLGHILMERGELAEAGSYDRQGLEMWQKLYPAHQYPHGHPFLARSLNNMGFGLQARGELAKAEPFLRQAVDMYRDILGVLAELSSETEALNFAASLPSTRDHYLSVTARLPEDPKVYARIWQGKGALMRIASRHHQDFLATQNDEAKPRVNALQQVRLELNRAINQPLPDAQKQAERMRALTQKKEDLEKAIARALHLEPPSSQQTPTPEELRCLLPAKTVFVDYLRYYRMDYDQGKTPGNRVTRTPHYVAFVLTREHPVKRIELGPANVIEEDLKTWRQAIERKGASVADARLSERLWKPLLEHIPGATEVVYLAPDGDLTRLPWPALPGRNPDKVLLEEHALAVVPHGLFLLQQMQHKPRSDKEEGVFLAYGAIRYDQPPGALDKKAVDILALNQDRGSEGNVHWQSLAGTARELDQVCDRAGRRKLKTLERRGSQASVAQLIVDLPKARWAHFATHGFFADADSRSILQLTPADYERSQSGERIQAVGRSPLLLSGIVLAGANRKNQDGDARFDPDGGIITGEGLTGLRLEDLDLAVLSACETGLGEVAGGEGVFGLQRSFHVAGTRNVVASLWKVEDDATAALMTLFYQKLWAEEKPPLVALREAQLHIYRHPEQIASLAQKRGLDFERNEPKPGKNSGRAATRQWAAFTLSGLGRPPASAPSKVTSAVQSDRASTDPAETVQIIGKAESRFTAKSRSPRPPDAAAIRTADIDRGKSLRASTDPAGILEIVGEVAPGFTARLPVIPGGVAIVAEHFGRKRVLSTHPLDPVKPCILTSTIAVPANKRTTLTFDVSHSAVGDWQLIVLANGERLFDADVGRATARNGWLSVSVNLTRFAGRQVVLELQNKATGWSHEWGFWDKVKITARKIPQ